MKPFNLEEAKAGKPLVTRYGGTARYLGEINNQSGRRIIFAITNKNDDQEYTASRYSNGKVYDSGTRVDDCDIFMAPTAVTKWVNILKEGTSGVTLGSHYLWDTEEEAKKRGSNSSSYITTVPVTFEV